MGWNLTGKASGITIGLPHTFQTADERMYPGELLAYINWCGMTGGHDGVLGMNKKESIEV